MLGQIATWRQASGALLLLVVGLLVTLLARELDGVWQSFAISLGAGVSVAGIAAIAVYVLISRYRSTVAGRVFDWLRADIDQALVRLQTSIEEQTNRLYGAGGSLTALESSGVDRMFSSRSDAVDELLAALEDPTTTSVYLIGVSLNDFVRGEGDMHRVWLSLADIITGENPPPSGERLRVRIMIADPHSLGPQIRSYGEGRQNSFSSGQLASDVAETARALHKLGENAAEKIDFEFRLYRLAPTFFGLYCNTASYMHPYYFWRTRRGGASFPLTKVTTGKLDTALRDHFDLIWEKASVDGDEWLNETAVGWQRGSYLAGVENYFVGAGKGLDRLVSLIEKAEETVWIQGISLRSFFGERDRLRKAIVSAAGRGVDIRVLLLDPVSDQALYRSYREHELSAPNVPLPQDFRAYVESGLHVSSALVHDTEQSIEWLSTQASTIQTRLYGSAPACFALIVDDRVFLEQYHYGSTPGPNEDPHAPTILGKDMPLVEFSRPGTAGEMDLFPEMAGVARSPYLLLADHFRFVFERSARPIDEIVDIREVTPVQDSEQSAGVDGD